MPEKTLDERLLPAGLAEAWRDAFGGELPKDFLWTYELLCEAFYWGAKPAAEWKLVSRAGQPGPWFFADPSLFEVKRRADRFLSEVATSLRRWSQERPVQGRKGPHAPGRLADVGTREARRPAGRREDPTDQEEVDGGR